MAFVLHKTTPFASTIRDLNNGAIKRIGAGSSFHQDACELAIAAADASSLATSLVLANELMALYLFHLADDLAHKVADPAPALTKATDLATAQTLANAIKSDYNTHRASTTYHYTADATNTITSADATDQSSLNTLLNELKADLTAHLAGAPTSGQMVRLVDA